MQLTVQPAFLTVQAGLVALLVLAGGGRMAPIAAVRPIRVGRLDEVELAASNSGWQLAVIAAITALRRSHVMQTTEGTLVANGPLVEDACELERELFETVRQAPDRSLGPDSGRAQASGRRGAGTLGRVAGRPSRSPLRRGDAGQRGAVVDGPRLRNGARPSRRDTDLGRLHDGVRGGSQLRRRLRLRMTSNIS